MTHIVGTPIPSGGAKGTYLKKVSDNDYDLGWCEDGIINVKDYGAVGDGSTDDTTSISNAIADLSTDKDVLYFPSGIYKTTTQLSITTPELVVLLGHNAYLMPTQSDNNPAITIDVGNRIVMSGITIDAMNSADTSTLVEIANAEFGAQIHDVHFKNAGGYGLDADYISKNSLSAANSDGVGLTLSQCSFVDSVGGLRMGNTNPNEYFSIESCTFAHLETAIYLKDAGNGTIDSCHIKYCTSYGIRQVTPASNGGKLVVSSCHLNHNDGISISWEYNNTDRPLNVLGCQFIANTDTAISLDGHRHVIVGNFFDRVGAGNNYIEFITCNQNIVKGNMVIGDGDAFLNGTSNDSDFTGNLIGVGLGIDYETITGTGNTFYNISPDGTPVAKQVGVWTGADSLEGDSKFLWEDNAGEGVKIKMSSVRLPSSGADDIVIEGSGARGMNILSTTTGNIYFGDVASALAGVIQYDHTGNFMRFYTNGAEAMRIDSSQRMNVVGGILPRDNSVASSATPSINVGTTDNFRITALATNVTSMTSGLSGTPQNGQKLTIEITATGAKRSVTWGASFDIDDVGVTYHEVGETDIMKFHYSGNDSKWILDRDVNPTPSLRDINTQVASYQLVLDDRDKLVEMNVGSANNLTVPPNSTIAFPINTEILISQYGAGQTTIVAGSGVTIRSAGGALKLASQYSGATLIKRGTNEWYLFGDITT